MLSSNPFIAAIPIELIPSLVRLERCDVPKKFESSNNGLFVAGSSSYTSTPAKAEGLSNKKSYKFFSFRIPPLAVLIIQTFVFNSFNSFEEIPSSHKYWKTNLDLLVLATSPI